MNYFDQLAASGQRAAEAHTGTVFRVRGDGRVFRGVLNAHSRSAKAEFGGLAVEADAVLVASREC